MFILKTEKGQQVMKDRSVPLTPRQRSAFIMFDGKRTLEDVLAATSSMGVTRADVDLMLEHGLIREAAPPAQPAAASAPAPAPVAPEAAAATEPAPLPGGGTPAGSGMTPQERYFAAYPIATQLTAGLGLRGFRLNLAVEGTHNYEELLQVAPKIRDAVGDEKFAPLHQALYG